MEQEFKGEEVLSNVNQSHCIICLEGLEVVGPHLVKLQPCDHYLCQNCFELYYQKSVKDKCPACQKFIEQYRTFNQDSNTLSDANDFQILIQDRKKESFDESSNPYECLDHQFFSSELTKLIQVRSEIEQDRFHRKVFNKDPNLQANIDLEWNCLKQIELRLYDLQDIIHSMKRFESDQMIKEVHEMTEALIKIKAGRMTNEQFTGLNFEDHHFNNHNYADDDMNDDYYDEYGIEDYGDEQYGIEQCKYVTKSLKKNKKPSIKQTSNIITQQVKRKA
ncbi:snf2 superfamily rad5 protein [Stylonychia lemnae]|uniref:Snf2 superfamily rad5 protein n=1 Tax=Stylonychia lemnae TaxID=5949 RepID=A0A077ZR20_STYLE|nr:snf2 superfamily rad5 protein [Stylonychia lemnae]|eukprot:CDW71899.1 snf2 superfamily rad5 protein [Stylonychia lemnae]